jgi:hypothetical protein
MKESIGRLGRQGACTALIALSCVLGLFLGTGALQSALAQDLNAQSILGVWITQDDDTKEPRAHIKITQDNGLLSGRIVKTLDPDALPDERCTRCTGDRKNQAMLGLEIIRGGQKNEKELVWEGGKILDPESGDEYRFKMRLLDQGRTLQVRGYLGPFWRTQIWTRQ